MAKLKFIDLFAGLGGLHIGSRGACSSVTVFRAVMFRHSFRDAIDVAAIICHP